MCWEHEQTPAGGLLIPGHVFSRVPTEDFSGAAVARELGGTWPRTECWEPGGGRRLSLVSGGTAQSQEAKARGARRPAAAALPRKAALQTDLPPEGVCRQLQLGRDRRPLWVMLRCSAQPHVLWEVSVSSLLGILIGVEVRARGSQVLAPQGCS